MPSLRRWRLAQEYERAYWEREAERLRTGAVAPADTWYLWKVSQMEKHLAGLLPQERKTQCRVLEIGSGPVGNVSFLGWGDCCAVDPLVDSPLISAAFSPFRNPRVRFCKARGEQLPFRDGSFGLVVLENVLDHVQAAECLLRECHRVLHGQGLMYLTLNVRTSWGSSLHALLARLLIDQGHPYSFTTASIRRMLRGQGFLIQRESCDDYRRARDQDRGSSSVKDKVKGYTGLSEFVFYAVCSKTP